MVDDLGSFIGIVTRKDIICYFLNQQAALQPEQSAMGCYYSPMNIRYFHGNRRALRVGF